MKKYNIFASSEVIDSTVNKHMFQSKNRPNNKHVLDQSHKNLEDEELLVGSVSRPVLFEEIVSRYERPFMRKALSILRDRDAAYDAIQETFVRIYMASNKFKKQEGASFSSWAYKILVNQCYTAHKKRSRYEVVSFDAEPAFAETIPDKASVNAIERHVMSDYILSMVSRLPDFLARAVNLYFIEGYAQKEIARMEGVSDETVRQRIYLAKKKLRKMNLEFSPDTSSYAP